MATVKVILKENKEQINGEIPLYLRIIKDRKPKYISLGYKILQKDWNPDQCKVKKSHPNSAWLNNFISHKVAEAQGITLQMETASNYIEPKAIKQAILGKSSMSFIEYAAAYLERSKGNNTVGTYKRYQTVIEKIKSYLGNANFTFNDLTPLFLKKYETHLQSKVPKNSPNTIHSNFKVIRHIITEAINDDLMPFEKNPFLRYQVKSVKTNIEFLTEKELSEIENLKLIPNSTKDHHRNLYVFATYAGGLRISDLLTLRWSSFDGERLLINTKKTNSTVSIKLPTKALEIIEIYQRLDTNDSDYIFPFLKDKVDVNDPEALHSFISSATAYTNGDLKEIALAAGIKKHVHFHTSRHTFATRALRKGARIEYVSKLLGHTNIKTTQIYAKIVNEDLDTAMELFN